MSRLLTDSFLFLVVTFLVASANLSAILLLISDRTLRLGLNFLELAWSVGSSIFMMLLAPFVRYEQRFAMKSFDYGGGYEITLNNTKKAILTRIYGYPTTRIYSTSEFSKRNQTY